ncbi:hypothetical protein Aconfl_33530 [Algoriphagus confluentis]|uniref:Uncharacterized protein n=1 Tax=Algoriphagus confluentis TaxID=1697556 RepID=A0ABQ6PRV0_9BACT|nr:hypothetical protein Aconfl_33530 [Algoriphagus confluentis]
MKKILSLTDSNQRSSNISCMENAEIEEHLKGYLNFP